MLAHFMAFVKEANSMQGTIEKGKENKRANIVMLGVFFISHIILPFQS